MFSGCSFLRVEGKRRMISRSILTAPVWLGLGLIVFAGCSKPEPPAPALPEQPVAPPPAAVAAPEIPDVDTVSEEQAKSNALFAEYRKQLQAGDLIQAHANLSALKNSLRGEILDDPFWTEKLPDADRLTLLVATLCSACADGACPDCLGHGACPTCEGSGLCTACKGTGGELKPCVTCLCATCGGTRVCAVCKGRRFSACSTCGGSGVGQTEKKFEPCPSCGGLGYKEGLKGPNGTGYRMKCIRCNGAKGVFSTIKHPCAACKGSGRQACGACRASGVCGACRGLGRKSDCPICHGQGRYLDPCPACNGAKTCSTCHGAKTCGACGGRGVCRECLGKNAVIRYRLPIDRGWLVDPAARLLRAGPDKPVAEPLTGTAAALTVKGRTVSADVPDRSLLWIAPPEELRQIRMIFKPGP